MNLIRKALLCLTLASAAAVSATASAAVIQDEFGPTLVILNADGFFGLPKSYTYTHNILDNGFHSPADLINSASLNLLLSDVLGSESWEVALGLDQAASGGNLANFSFTNIALGLTGTSILDLMDGAITTTITATRGSFEFIKSTLTVDYTPNGNTVPEPATLATLGIGLLGLMGARRRKRS